MKKDKRMSTSFVPYRKNASGVFEYFLQMRDEHAPMYASQFGLFGGGLDGEENLLEAMMRETHEELEYTPQKPRYFSRFEDARAIYNIFIEEVGADFERMVHVNEGKYGAFLTDKQVLHTDSVAPHVVPIIDDLERALKE